mmetsp:Transcript_4253/g.16044  ORF Transcript_4253/g.16044 Transcript_4253/m.16044 type:complete len:83 (-) Transcript_4253:398-646(-)
MIGFAANPIKCFETSGKSASTTCEGDKMITSTYSTKDCTGSVESSTSTPLNEKACEGDQVRFCGKPSIDFDPLTAQYTLDKT